LEISNIFEVLSFSINQQLLVREVSIGLIFDMRYFLACFLGLAVLDLLDCVLAFFQKNKRVPHKMPIPSSSPKWKELIFFFRLEIDRCATATLPKLGHFLLEKSGAAAFLP